jgi:hypothetical protein
LVVAKVLRSRPQDLEVGLEGRHEDHIIEDYNIIPLLADLDAVDQLLVGGSAEAEHLLADAEDLIELDG